jgi:hypothetical protein
MDVWALWHALAVLRAVWRSIAVEDHNMFEVIGQNASRHQAGDTTSDNSRASHLICLRCWLA